MSEMPHRLLAVANSPLSSLGAQPQSAIAVVHNVPFASLAGSPCPGEARLSLSGDRKTLTVSVQEGGIGDPEAVEVWRLTRAAHWGAKQTRVPGASEFIVVVLDTPRKPHPARGFELVFDLAQSATFSGSIDTSYLRRRGVEVPDAAQATIGGLFPAPSPAPRAQPEVQATPAPALQQPETARVGAASSAPRGRPARRRRNQPTGPFPTRRDLTARVWALRRQQVFPNLAAIARACDITPDVVKTIIEEREGLDTYLQQGCLLG